MVSRTPFCSIKPGYSRWIRGISAQSVDGLSRERDKLTALEQMNRLFYDSHILCHLLPSAKYKLDAANMTFCCASCKTPQ
jgi:hypothetical protein